METGPRLDDTLSMWVVTLVALVVLAAGCGARSDLQVEAPAREDAGVDGVDAGTDADTPDPRIEPAIQVSAGLFHTCAATRNGRVHCWGFNNQGQLGDGTSENRLDPVPSPGVTDAISVTAGRSHTCALRATGQVLCWGDNLYGQLGDGSMESTRQELPVAVVGLSDVIQVDAGGEHTCAVTGGGVVFCWGNGQQGQLGIVGGSRSPVQASLSVAAVEVSAGFTHTCARLVDGRIECWGDAASPGPTALDPWRPQDVPMLVVDTVGLTSGDFETCAVGVDGQLLCWEFFGASPGPAQLVAGEAVQASAGHEFRCLLRADQTVRCMGNNERGQLGDQGADQRPGAEVEPLGLPPSAVVTAGWRHACALDTMGVVRCWGRNQEGELGDGTAGEYRAPVIAGVFRD